MVVSSCGATSRRRKRDLHDDIFSLDIVGFVRCQLTNTQLLPWSLVLRPRSSLLFNLDDEISPLDLPTLHFKTPFVLEIVSASHSVTKANRVDTADMLGIRTPL